MTRGRLCGQLGAVQRRWVFLNKKAPIILHVIICILRSIHVICLLQWLFLHDKTTVRIHVFFVMMFLVRLLPSLLYPCTVSALLGHGWLYFGVATTLYGLLLLVEGDGM